MGIDNLRKMYDLAGSEDIREGKVAYERYNIVMRRFSEFYKSDFNNTVEAFVALSPNNDYKGNLRSLASVLAGFNLGTPVDLVTVSTYNACRDRAMSYLTGDADFLKTVKGKKITAFRDNILNYETSREVTIDGHMIAAWLGAEKMTMREANMLRFSYEMLADGCRDLADEIGMLPHQLQATIWFVRKRVLRIKYDDQLGLFDEPGDLNKTLCWPQDFPPYPNKGD